MEKQSRKRTMYLGQEFVSRFGDGSGLTTTTNAAVGSDPTAGIYFRTFPGLELESLYRKHLEGLERFRNRKGLEPVPLDVTLASVAQEIELAFERQAKSQAAELLKDEESVEEGDRDANDQLNDDLPKVANDLVGEDEVSDELDHE